MFNASTLPLFVTVARTGSFSAAAQRLGIPTTTLSRRIQELEEALGVRLLNRTTRSLSLTDAGERYLAEVEPIVEALEQANRAIKQLRETVTGRLRITAPYLLGELFLADWAIAFQQQHPQVAIELQLDNHLLDLPATGIDLALRAGILEDTSLIAQRLFDVDWLTVASPAFLARAPALQQPTDLAQVAVITTRVDPGRAIWPFGRGENAVNLQMDSRLQVNDLRIACQAAQAGLGIARLPRLLAQTALTAGTLVEILADWRAEATPVQLVYQRRRLLTAAQKAFIQFVLEQARDAQAAWS
ncbi:MAG: LysR family transcriptional regulator [Gammaproteobacteria bacterium]|nr:LysR family transcriptional regulator [Gammaproteobacteria bacterium]